MAMPHDPFQALVRAVEIAGGQSAFARIVGCTPGNINQLIRKASPLSGKYVLKAEAGTGISRHDLRPDLYPLEIVQAGPSTSDIEIAR